MLCDNTAKKGYNHVERYGLFQKRVTNTRATELRSCVKVEVAVLCVLPVPVPYGSVDVKQH